MRVHVAQQDEGAALPVELFAPGQCEDHDEQDRLQRGHRATTPFSLTEDGGREQSDDDLQRGHGNVQRVFEPAGRGAHESERNRQVEGQLEEPWSVGHAWSRIRSDPRRHLRLPMTSWFEAGTTRKEDQGPPVGSGNVLP